MPGALMPALLKRTSSRPKASRVLANSAWTSSGLPTSADTASILPPEDVADAAVFSSSTGRRPASTTEYPADCRAIATLRPMPLPAPVTRAILPLVIMFLAILRLQSDLKSIVPRSNRNAPLLHAIERSQMSQLVTKWHAPKDTTDSGNTLIYRYLTHRLVWHQRCYLSHRGVNQHENDAVQLC